MKVVLTLEFDSPAEAQNALAALRAPNSATINPADRPDAGFPPNPPGEPVAATGAMPALPTATGMPNVGFGQGVTLPPGATPALSSAGAAPLQTAPVAPPASGIPTPPPAPPAPAPTIAATALVPGGAAAQSPPAPPAAGPELDAGGLPWDQRIHASTKTKNKTDGLWRGKRDLDPSIKAAVEAELRQLMAMNSAAAAPAAAPAPASPPAPPPAPTPTSAPAASPTEATFSSLMERLAPLMEKGKITTEHVQNVLRPLGLNGIGQLALAPNLVPQVAAGFDPLFQAAAAGLL